MTNSHTLRALAAAALLGLAACNDDDDPAPPPPPPLDPAFSTFVLNQFAATADDTEPAAINDTSFDLDVPEGAFDGLLE